MGAAPTVLDAPWGGTEYSPASPLDIASIESAIVQRLQSAVGGLIEVAHYPDNPESYEMRHRVGVALVIFHGAEYGKLQDTGLVAQERTLEFSVALRVRDLGWAYGGPPSGTSPGAYQLLEAIRIALTGFQANGGCTKMYPRRERFLERDKQGGVWVYQADFATRMIAVESYQQPNFPLLQTAIALEDGNQTILTVPAGLYTFNSGGAIQLPNQNVSAVTVSNQGNGSVYLPGIDYTVDNVNGVVYRLQGGAIPADATVYVAYSFAEVIKAVANGGTAPLNPNN